MKRSIHTMRRTGSSSESSFTKSHMRSDGFTVIELMVATMVFSVVLLVITYGVLHFTNSYYKGINSSTTQTAAQNAIDTISQAIQFNAADPVVTDGTQGFFCAGNKLFVYQLGVVFAGDPTTTTGLYEMAAPSGNCASASPAGGTELLTKNMRLSSISVTTPKAGLWNVSLVVAYGDADLLCNRNITGNNKGGCAQTATSYLSNDAVSGDDVTCKTQVGSQFCSVAALSTVAQQRLGN